MWQACVRGDLEGVYYTYVVTNDGRAVETADPYSKACGVNGARSMVVDLGRTDPDGWQADGHPSGIEAHPVIYELHIKDFSHDIHSGVSEEHRGKYLAFTEEDTSLDGRGDFPTCLAYLKMLGVTYVHLLPCFDFGSVDEGRPELDQFNWGYDPVNYFVPEGSYATDAADGHVRIREFKQMVMALHAAGIGVIMDMVFNHTYSLESSLQKTVPDYYYRMDDAGVYSNGSGCGNDTASERPMFRRYMADCVCYWAREYHIDGFRFDLMGLHDVRTMNEIRRRLDALPGGEHLLMYGEPWAAGTTAWDDPATPAATADHLSLLDERIAVFCDRTRDGIKGSVFDARDGGYVNGGEAQALALKRHMEATACAWCGGDVPDCEYLRPRAPSQIINYVSSHDDLTLWDKLLASMRGAADDCLDYGEMREDILQMNRMAAGIILTSLGIPFFQAGEEFGRTKLGCHNSYDQPARLNHLDWRRACAFWPLVDYYRTMIGLRKEIPVLGDLSADAAGQVHLIERADAVIGFTLGDQALVYDNPYDEARAVDLPDGAWLLMSDGARHWDEKGICKMRGRVDLAPKSVTVFFSLRFSENLL